MRSAFIIVMFLAGAAFAQMSSADFFDHYGARSAYPLTNGLQVYFQFERGSLDSAFGGHTLTNNTSGSVTQFGPGKYGQGVVMDYTNLYVLIGGFSPTTYPWSISAWYKNQEFEVQVRIAVAIQEAANSYLGIGRRVSGSEVYPYAAHRATTLRQIINTAVGGVQSNVFHHACVVAYTRTNVFLYADSIQVNSGVISDPLSGMENNPEGALALLIGNEGSRSVGAFIGTIDEVKVWSVALSSNNVKEDYYYAP